MSNDNRQLVPSLLWFLTGGKRENCRNSLDSIESKENFHRTGQISKVV